MRYFLLLSVFFSSGCTYSINMIHSEGVASDVVDETQAPTATITPTVSLP